MREKMNACAKSRIIFLLVQLLVYTTSDGSKGKQRGNFRKAIEKPWNKPVRREKAVWVSLRFPARRTLAVVIGYDQYQ